MINNIFEDIKPNVISRDLKGYSLLIYGEKKSGKTTNATKFEKHLILGAEKGWSAIPNAMAVPINTWSDTTKYTGQLLMDAKQVELGKQAETHFQTIIVDTADLMWSIAEKHICQINNVTKLDDTENKCGYKQLEKMFEDWFLSLIKAGYTVIFISHSEDKQSKDPKTGEKQNKTVPTMEKRCAKVICRAVDIMAYAGMNYDSDGNIVTTLRMRGTPDVEAGSRFKYQSAEIPFTYQALVDDVKQAIEKEEAESGVTATAERKNLFTEATQPSLTFAEVMAKVNTYGMAFNKAGKISNMQSVVKKEFGKDTKLSQCTEDQKEAVEAVLNKLELLAVELGIDLK